MSIILWDFVTMNKHAHPHQAEIYLLVPPVWSWFHFPAREVPWRKQNSTVTYPSYWFLNNWSKTVQQTLSSNEKPSQTSLLLSFKHTGHLIYLALSNIQILYNTKLHQGKMIYWTCFHLHRLKERVKRQTTLVTLPSLSCFSDGTQYVRPHHYQWAWPLTAVAAGQNLYSSFSEAPVNLPPQDACSPVNSTVWQAGSQEISY